MRQPSFAWFPSLCIVGMAVLLSACGDRPLLTTALPNGYSLASTDGSDGTIQTPAGLVMAEHFAKQADGSERWCQEFGWSGDIVVCRYVDAPPSKPADGIPLGYFVLDTRTADVFIAPDESALLLYLRDQKNGMPMPLLSKRHPTTRSR